MNSRTFLKFPGSYSLCGSGFSRDGWFNEQKQGEYASFDKSCSKVKWNGLLKKLAGIFNFNYGSERLKQNVRTGMERTPSRHHGVERVQCQEEIQSFQEKKPSGAGIPCHLAAFVFENTIPFFDLKVIILSDE